MKKRKEIKTIKPNDIWIDTRKKHWIIKEKQGSLIKLYPCQIFSLGDFTQVTIDKRTGHYELPHYYLDQLIIPASERSENFHLVNLLP